MNITCLGKPIKLLTLALCTVILFTTKSISQDAQKIRIDPAQAYGGHVSEYFESVEYIPLETTKESLFGEIHQIVVTDSSYVITDLDTKYALFFTHDGKFKRKIKCEKDGRFGSLYYQLVQKKVLLINYEPAKEKWRVQVYSQLGKPESQFEIKNGHTDKWVNAVPIDDGNCHFVKEGCEFSGSPADTTMFLLSVFENGTLRKSFFPRNQKQNMAICQLLGWPPNLTPAPDDKSVYVSIPGDYGIYKATKDTIVKLYQLVFPNDRTFPEQLKTSTDSKFLESMQSKLASNDKIITHFDNIHINNDVLFFRLESFYYKMNFDANVVNPYSLFYNIKTGRVSAFERITPDSTNYYLPLFRDFSINVLGLYPRNGYFYTNLSSLRMFTEYENNKSRNPNPQYPPALQEYFKTQNRKSNPVIVKMKMKE